MSSRKDQKEALRQERLERERQAKEAERRKKLVGYGIGGALAVAAVVVLVVLLVSGGGGGGNGGGEQADADVLPDGGKVPAQQITDLRPAAEAAGCEVETARNRSREHTQDLAENIEYSTNPPMGGKHFVEWTEDGAYGEPEDIKRTVHSLEHGRVVVWFKKSLPESARATLKALYDQDPYQMILTPNESMPFEVAASAWTRDPQPNGTGHMIGCSKFGPKTTDALLTFRDEFRGQGPEPVP